MYIYMHIYVCMYVYTQIQTTHCILLTRHRMILLSIHTTECTIPDYPTHHSDYPSNHCDQTRHDSTEHTHQPTHDSAEHTQ